MRPPFPTLVALAAPFLFAFSGLNRAEACTDVVLPLDDAMRAPATFSDFLTRDTSLFMLRGLVESPGTTIVDDGANWTVDCDRISAPLATALAGAVAFDGTLDPGRLREVFEANYLGTIAQRAQDGQIKSTLAAFKQATNFTTWADTVVEFSSIKRKTRRIFRSPAGFVPAISVSQTLDSQTGDVTAPVLETEVGVLRANGEDWDFYAYNHEGQLSSYSTFPAGERPSPRICIACHYDSGSRAVQRFFPR